MINDVHPPHDRMQQLEEKIEDISSILQQLTCTNVLAHQFSIPPSLLQSDTSDLPIPPDLTMPQVISETEMSHSYTLATLGGIGLPSFTDQRLAAPDGRVIRRIHHNHELAADGEILAANQPRVACTVGGEIYGKNSPVVKERCAICGHFCCLGHSSEIPGPPTLVRQITNGMQIESLQPSAVRVCHNCDPPPPRGEVEIWPVMIIASVIAFFVFAAFAQRFGGY